MTIESTRVVVEPARVETYLRRLFNLSLLDMEGVANAIHSGFVKVSALHPKGFNGTSAWADGSASIRETMIVKGWTPDDPQNQPRVVSRNRSLAITVSSGDARTGVLDTSPKTRNDKGSQTAHSVNFNARQGNLFPIDQAIRGPRAVRQDGQTLWMLLYYIDIENGELRYELSVPTAMGENEKVNDWSIRLIFPALPLGPTISEQPIDDLPDIDIEVTPKIA